MTLIRAVSFGAYSPYFYDKLKEICRFTLNSNPTSNSKNNLMEYNTQLEDLKMGEYGRNIQKLIEHLHEVKDENNIKGIFLNQIEFIFLLSFI